MTSTSRSLTDQLRTLISSSESCDAKLRSLTEDRARLTAEATGLREERDEIAKALHSAKLQGQTWKQETQEWTSAADQWKARADKCELTISHQADTIATLEREAASWREQCVSLQGLPEMFKETATQLRVEAQHWKEQCQRLEQEKMKLSQKYDALVAEQLARSNALATPVSKPSHTKATPSASTSASKHRTSSKHQAYGDEVDDPRSPTMVAHEEPSSPSNYQRPIPSSSKAKAKDQTVPAPTPGTMQFIRRVHAVIEVPVKEEDDSENPLLDDLDGSLPPSDEAEESEEEEVEERPRRKSARRVISYDDAYDDDDLEEDGYIEKAPAKQKARRKREDESAAEVLRRRSRSKKSAVEEEAARESDEDELRLVGGEDERKGVYAGRAAAQGPRRHSGRAVEAYHEEYELSAGGNKRKVAKSQGASGAKARRR